MHVSIHVCVCMCVYSCVYVCIVLHCIALYCIVLHCTVLSLSRHVLSCRVMSCHQCKYVRMCVCVCTCIYIYIYIVCIYNVSVHVISPFQTYIYIYNYIYNYTSQLPVQLPFPTPGSTPMPAEASETHALGSEADSSVSAAVTSLPGAQVWPGCSTKIHPNSLSHQKQKLNSMAIHLLFGLVACPSCASLCGFATQRLLSSGQEFSVGRPFAQALA